MQPVIPYGAVFPDFSKGFVQPKISDEALRALRGQIKEILLLRRRSYPSIGFPPESLLTQIPQFFEDARTLKQRCGCWRYIYINSKGEVRGCLFSESLGTIRQRTLAEIRSSGSFGLFRRFARQCKICLKGSQYCEHTPRLLLHLVKKEFLRHIAITHGRS